MNDYWRPVTVSLADRNECLVVGLSGHSKIVDNVISAGTSNFRLLKS